MAPQKEGFVDIEPEVFEKEYLKPVHRVGFWTCVGVSVAMFVPPLLLYLIYGTFAPWEAIGAGMALALTYAVPFFFIGIWACGVSGRNLGVQDHGALVWDEIVAFLPLAALTSHM